MEKKPGLDTRFTFHYRAGSYSGFVYLAFLGVITFLEAI